MHCQYVQPSVESLLPTGCRHDVWVRSWSADLSDLERMAKAMWSSDAVSLDLHTIPDWSIIPADRPGLHPKAREDDTDSKHNTVWLERVIFDISYFYICVFIYLFNEDTNRNYLIHTHSIIIIMELFFFF